MPRFPTVHLNGTSGEALLDQNTAARNALRLLVDAISAAAPNARDYYTQGSDAFNHANNEHKGRLAMLDRIRIDLDEIGSDIHRQLDERSR